MYRIGTAIATTVLGLIARGTLVAAADIGPPDRRPGIEGRVALLVPAYFYPSGRRREDWARLAEAARSIPMTVILNPASGPGRRRDPNYVAVLAELRRAGARVLGYVDSDYGRRPLAAVERDMGAYRGLYEIDGYFIDQMANGPEAVEYYRSIRRSIRGIDPGLEVVANPGTSTRPEYLDAADTLAIFEGPAQKFAGHDPRAAAPWIAGHPPRRFAALVYGASTPAAGREALSRAVRSGAGSVYITDQKMPNPYLGLPPYWTDQVAAIRAINESARAAPMSDRPAAPKARPRDGPSSAPGLQ